MSNTEVTEEINSDKMTTTNLVQPLSDEELLKMCYDCVYDFMNYNTTPKLINISDDCIKSILQCANAIPSTYIVCGIALMIKDTYKNYKNLKTQYDSVSSDKYSEYDSKLKAIEKKLRFIIRVLG